MNDELRRIMIEHGGDEFGKDALFFVDGAGDALRTFGYVFSNPLLMESPTVVNVREDGGIVILDISIGIENIGKIPGCKYYGDNHAYCTTIRLENTAVPGATSNFQASNDDLPLMQLTIREYRWIGGILRQNYHQLVHLYGDAIRHFGKCCATSHYIECAIERLAVVRTALDIKHRQDCPNEYDNDLHFDTAYVEGPDFGPQGIAYGLDHFEKVFATMSENLCVWWENQYDVPDINYILANLNLARMYLSNAEMAAMSKERAAVSH